MVTRKGSFWLSPARDGVRGTSQRRLKRGADETRRTAAGPASSELEAATAESEAAGALQLPNLQQKPKTRLSQKQSSTYGRRKEKFLFTDAWESLDESLRGGGAAQVKALSLLSKAKAPAGRRRRRYSSTKKGRAASAPPLRRGGGGLRFGLSGNRPPRAAALEKTHSYLPPATWNIEVHEPPLKRSASFNPSTSKPPTRSKVPTRSKARAALFKPRPAEATSRSKARSILPAPRPAEASSPLAPQRAGVGAGSGVRAASGPRRTRPAHGGSAAIRLPTAAARFKAEDHSAQPDPPSPVLEPADRLKGLSAGYQHDMQVMLGIDAW